MSDLAVTQMVTITSTYPSSNLDAQSVYITKKNVKKAHYSLCVCHGIASVFALSFSHSVHIVYFNNFKIIVTDCRI